jgi:coenzyme F420 hydrogenase subunit beta
LSRKYSNVEDIAARHLCMGCGACAGLNPGHIEMVETVDHAWRPRCITKDSRQGDVAEQSVRVCPGSKTDYRPKEDCKEMEATLFDEWGPVLEVWEGFAKDDELRFRGSSGGLVNALALYCIEKGGMRGALHVKARKDIPYLNESSISCDRDALLEGSGSRYAPASPCDRLHEVENGQKPVVLIGKPCDIAAANNAARERPKLKNNLGLTIGIFCAGVPSLSGSFDLMRHVGSEDPSSVRELRYRGQGWPGNMTVVASKSGGETHQASVSYETGWGEILQKKRQWRCHVCVDHTGELADLSVGDPWYRAVSDNDPGKSLLVVRTRRGQRILREAIEAGHVVVERRSSSILPASQKNLLRTRGSLWGRLAMLRMMGAPYPRYTGLRLFGVWRKRLSPREKAQSFYGTALRVFRKGLYTSERWKLFDDQTCSSKTRAVINRDL